MAKRSFSVRALWDDDAKVFYSESDIIGLHIEASSLDEFEAAMMELAPELIVANHLDKTVDASRMSWAELADLIPAILWERPTDDHVIA